MKVLHISGAKGWGGNEQQIIDLIPELNNLKVQNVVLGVRNSLLQRECERRNITFVEAKNNRLNSLQNFCFLKTLVKQIEPDIIHLHTSDSLTYFTISDLLFRLKTKTVFSKKGMGASGSFLSKLKYNYWGIQSIFCVSKNVEQKFSELLYKKNKHKTTVIHDCVSTAILDSKENINLRDKFSIVEDHFIIGNIANHTRAKDLYTFVNVVDYLVNKLGRKDIVFFQIGEFSKQTTLLQASVNEKQLQSYIFFTDKIENAFNLNSQFDLFLLTSQREGGPTSVLEAMLIGAPVVSTNVGVISDIIVDGVNGFISPVYDHEDLAKKIVILLKDKNLQKKFIAESKLKISEDFVVTKIANQTLEEYKKIFEL